VAYVIVLLVAAAVGAAVYYLTIRRGVIPLGGFGGEPASPRLPPPNTPPMAPPGPSTYVSVIASKPDWQSRMTGILGLAVAVVVGAVALAGSIYLSASWLVRLIGHATKSD
jgi:hypothetical protein